MGAAGPEHVQQFLPRVRLSHAINIVGNYLPKQFRHHTRRLHADEPLIEALKFECEAHRVEAQQVQDGGVQVVDVNPVARDVEAELVALAERDAGLDAAAGQPHCECVRMMVAAVVAAALHHGRAAEFAAPNHERLV